MIYPLPSIIFFLDKRVKRRSHQGSKYSSLGGLWGSTIYSAIFGGGIDIFFTKNYAKEIINDSDP